MRQWEVVFTDGGDEPVSVWMRADEKPSEEEAAGAIRAQLFPIVDDLHLDDPQAADCASTARWLREQAGVTITWIGEAA
ncbi:hypothetical protein ACGFXC_33185 [Streptomyces sp. NPDC048507]|uniref:hypothetical protein n=1 Tax=Streptomyces sp. NPDC048507 TaxID=3365560 RepID=UPI0037235C62